MTPAERKLAFKRKLMSKGVDISELEDNLAKWVFILEKETGAFIDDNYPLLKFYSNMDSLQWYRKEEEKQTKKSMRK